MSQQSPPAQAEPLDRIFAYRALDLRDRFPQPLETFREALECLQSDRAYLPSWRGKIIAYLRGGDSVVIPESLYFLEESGMEPAIVPTEFNDEVCAEVEQWLRQKLHTAKGAEGPAHTLETLLQQCDPSVPEPMELKEWRDAPPAGREIGNPPSSDDIWQVVERALGGKRQDAEYWMNSPSIALCGRKPVDTLREDPQVVLDLIIRLECWRRCEG